MKKPKPIRMFNVFGTAVPVYPLKNLGSVENMLGYFDPVGKYIAVDAALEGPTLEQTLIHELFHAVLDRLYIDSQIDPTLLEVLIENLTVAMVENFEVKKK